MSINWFYQKKQQLFTCYYQNTILHFPQASTNFKSEEYVKSNYTEKGRRDWCRDCAIKKKMRVLFVIIFYL